MRTLFTFCFSFFAFFLSAQEVKFSFDKTNILLGEPIKMTIEAVVGAGQNSDLFSIDTLPHFEVLDQSKIDTTMQGGSLRLKQLVVITSWDSGSWQLPAVIRDGKAMQPVAIEVSYTSPWDPKQPYHDIKGIAPVKNPGKSTWWWYVIGLAVLIALFLLFFPEGKKDKTVSELDAGAYKKAMQALDKLQKDNLAADNVKQYYTELINIFRTYLKGAKGIQSFSKTTDDLSIQLQALKMPQTDYNNLVQTLRLSDLVKFAQYKPDATSNTNAFTTIKESINTIEGRNAV
ncbi:MAG: hypothetical protein EOO10_02220 [Chitinophagaceae bacterium]|nr:MAG: hypothetical protein EOO10_02220 [Chitinophagaceae bacterium]